MNSAIDDIAWETVITGTLACNATRSAVRCRVPVSMVGNCAEGVKWTPAARMVVRSWSTTMPPSIFASSRNAVGVKSVFTLKPPVEIWPTTGLLPSTINAPVRPVRIRSSPSRSGVPGASRAR